MPHAKRRLLLVHFPGLDVLRPFSSAEKQEKAVYDLIGRVFGSKYQKQFLLTVDSTMVGDSDVVIVSDPGSLVH